MARIARRGLRLRELPLFSLGSSWQSVADASGKLALRLFEQRYLELARRVLPPRGAGKFGYAEGYPPRAGGTGVLAEVEDYRWGGKEQLASAAGSMVGGGGGLPEGQVLLSARDGGRFRILSVRQEEIVSGSPPLYLAHVQLLHPGDLQRGPAREALDYWASRAGSVRPGVALTAKQAAPVFESVESWREVGEVPAGVLVVAAGPPVVVEGYLMVPIAPSGAVELSLFRDRTPGDALSLPSAAEVKAALLNIGAEPQVPRGAPDEAEGRGRRQRRRRGGG
eukprot:TRINITY_DN24787_c0_g1_i1.p1 TRINITY_DN24787_c0_g1~~TRINITY_DN24787_c0_g1_i1.p1  ORF type:complete len:298 (+),score=77.36 TRINITY_DN24787_c0_g1_i1:56-895(+)